MADERVTVTQIIIYVYEVRQVQTTAGRGSSDIVIAGNHKYFFPGSRLELIEDFRDTEMLRPMAFFADIAGYEQNI